MATEPATIRTMADVERNLPRWVAMFALRLSRLEQGRAHEIILIMPKQGDPMWSVRELAKLENE